MNVKEAIQSLSLEESALFLVMASYLERVQEADPKVCLEVQEQVASDPSFRERTLQCVCDAMVYSTLTVTLTAEADFEEAADMLRASGDDFLDRMRLSLYDEALEIAVHATSPGKKQAAKIGKRAERLRAIFSA